ncbi:hypothetical protein ACFQPF_05560 [Fictibacillus iocasae]|uniref:SbsC C-terminal domain-containing protein n=1 Tax=Fictibacillus iocasae TaxID=2715437 RepID=A0ABW2NPF1_9BACL
MNTKKMFKIATAGSVAASAFVAAAPADAAVYTAAQVNKLVSNAKKAEASLRARTQADDAQNLVWGSAKTRLATLKSEVAKAQAAIKTLKTSKERSLYTSKLQSSVDKIGHGEKFLAAVAATNTAKVAVAKLEATYTAENLKGAEDAIAAAELSYNQAYSPAVRAAFRAHGAELAKHVAAAKEAAGLAVKVKAAEDAVAALESKVAELKTEDAVKAAEAAKTTADSAVASLPAGHEKIAGLKTKIDAAQAKIVAAKAALATPKVESVSAINATQAVVTFAGEIGEVAASNFTVDKSVTVIKAEVNPSNKKEVTLTFNQSLIDNDSYKVTVDGVKSATGTAMKEAATVEFKYEIAAVKTVQLSKTKFYDGDSILDAVVVKDTNGLVLENSTLDIEIASTDSAVNTTTGDVTTAVTKSFYVEIKVKDGSEVLATTGAVKVDIAPELEVAGFDGLHIGALTLGDEATEYETAKKANKLDSSLKVNENGEILNLFAKDVDGNIVLLSPVASPLNFKITNLTPTVANVTEVNGQFVINTITTGKAQAKIKVGDLETTVTFDVIANEKIAEGTLGSNKVSLDTSTNAITTTETVALSLKDQYGDAIVYPANIDPSKADTASVVTYDDGSKLSVKSGNTRVAEATVADNGEVTVSLPAQNGIKGSTTVTVEFKDASGKVVFTKSIAVTASDFDSAVAKYDLVLTSSNSVLDADNDANETGVDLDDEVTFVLKQLDKYGNVIGTETLGTDAVITATTSNIKDQDFIDAVSYASTTGTVALTADAVNKLTNTGTVKFIAKVGGVAVDTLDVVYKNTDSVATKAAVNTANRTVDLSVLGGTTVSVDELLFGKLNVAGTKYALNPVLTVQDQFGKTMDYDIANGLDLLKNGLTVVPSTPVLTNLSNVTNNAGVLELTDASKTGSVTIVVPTVSTSANADLLAAPVSITVTLVK